MKDVLESRSDLSKFAPFTRLRNVRVEVEVQVWRPARYPSIAAAGAGRRRRGCDGTSGMDGGPVLNVQPANSIPMSAPEVRQQIKLVRFLRALCPVVTSAYTATRMPSSSSASTAISKSAHEVGRTSSRQMTAAFSLPVQNRMAAISHGRISFTHDSAAWRRTLSCHRCQNRSTRSPFRR